MITTTSNIDRSETTTEKPVTKAIETWEQTGDFRWYVDNRIPSDTTSVLQQKWVNSEGKVHWSDVPVVFSNPVPIKNFKS